MANVFALLLFWVIMTCLIATQPGIPNRCWKHWVVAGVISAGFIGFFLLLGYVRMSL